MKTNYYLVLVLLLSFSLASAQDNVVEKTLESSVVISETVQEEAIVINEVKETEATVIENDLARTNSDIKIYLNRLRNEGTINLLFPKINKVKTA